MGPLQDAEANWRGYAALARLDPENTEFTYKVENYLAANERQREQVLTRFNTQVDDFNGVTFYLHRNKPRYEDSRSYLQPYLAVTDTGRVTLRFRLNYTADSWLFVNNAAFNIDGQIVRLPGSPRWNRDNDSEIWEWVDVVANQSHRRLLEQIAASERTVVRFNGQQYYDNITIGASDKAAIRDVLLAEEVLRDQQN